MQTFGRGVLDVSHVEIEPAAIEKKSAIARRFLVVTVMKVDRAGIRLSKEVVLYLRRPKLGIYVRLISTEKTTVFGFDSDDAIHRNPTNAPNPILAKSKKRSALRGSDSMQTRGGQAQEAKHTSGPISPALGTLLSTALSSGICRPIQMPL
jgi:hypothetical protein